MCSLKLRFKFFYIFLNKENLSLILFLPSVTLPSRPLDFPISSFISLHLSLSICSKFWEIYVDQSFSSFLQIFFASVLVFNSLTDFLNFTNVCSKRVNSSDVNCSNPPQSQERRVFRTDPWTAPESWALSSWACLHDKNIFVWLTSEPHSTNSIM